MILKKFPIYAVIFFVPWTVDWEEKRGAKVNVYIQSGHWFSHNIQTYVSL